MNKKITIWKVLLVLVILAVLVAGGAMLFRLGYVRGAAGNIPWLEWGGKETPFGKIPFDKHPFNQAPLWRTPFGWRPWHHRAFPLMFPGLFCFGGLFTFLIFSGLGIYLNRRWIYRKHGPNDPWHFWTPPADGKPAKGESLKTPLEDE